MLLSSVNFDPQNAVWTHEPLMRYDWNIFPNSYFAAFPIYIYPFLRGLMTAVFERLPLTRGSVKILQLFWSRCSRAHFSLYQDYESPAAIQGIKFVGRQHAPAGRTWENVARGRHREQQTELASSLLCSPKIRERKRCLRRRLKQNNNHQAYWVRRFDPHFAG